MDQGKSDAASGSSESDKVGPVACRCMPIVSVDSPSHGPVMSNRGGREAFLL